MKNNKNAPKSLGALFNKSDTIIAVSISLPIYWGERRLKVLISYVIGFPLFVIVLFNIILGVHFEPGLLELIKN